MKPLRPILAVMRPVNSSMVGLGVIVGIAIASPSSILSLGTMLGFVAGFLISSFSMAVNDYYDYEVDKVNQPTRPLPSGEITLSSVKALATVLLTLGLVVSILTGALNFLIAVLFAGIGWFYSSGGKKRGLEGNVMVAVSITIPYIYGALAVGKGGDPLILLLSLTTFLASTGREIVKTISDVSGDALRDIRSIARVRGNKVAARLGGGLFLTAVASSWLPVVMGIVGFVYNIAILVPNLIFIYTSIRIFKDPSEASSLHVKKVALLGMLTGLATFLIEGILRG